MIAKRVCICCFVGKLVLTTLPRQSFENFITILCLNFQITEYQAIQICASPLGLVRILSPDLQAFTMKREASYWQFLQPQFQLRVSSGSNGFEKSKFFFFLKFES